MLQSQWEGTNPMAKQLLSVASAIATVFLATYPGWAQRGLSNQAQHQVQAKPNALPAHVLLEETYWRLIELNGQLLARPPDSQEAHIVLHAAGKTFTGGGGCNRLIGTYVRNGDALRFKMISSTMMACPGPVMKQEQTLNKALSSTVRFRIAGSTLELLDDRQPVAKFEARPAK
jgi:heat shock protein HslJ